VPQIVAKVTPPADETKSEAPAPALLAAVPPLPPVLAPLPVLHSPPVHIVPLNMLDSPPPSPPAVCPSLRCAAGLSRCSCGAEAGCLECNNVLLACAVCDATLCVACFRQTCDGCAGPLCANHVIEYVVPRRGPPPLRLCELCVWRHLPPDDGDNSDMSESEY